MTQLDFNAPKPSGTEPDFLTGGGEMGRRMRAFPWQDTALGLPETWPRSLKTAIRIMLTSRYAMWMAWGNDLIFFCNDAYLPTLGVKQEWALGSRSEIVWAEVWEAAGPRIDHVLRTGEATWDEGLQLLLERSGFPEETYHTFSYSPLPGDHGGVEGMLCVVMEETERVIGERRLKHLRDLASALATATSMGTTRRAVELALERCHQDLPFTLTYLVEGEESRLAFISGIDPAHPLAVPHLDGGKTGSPWPLSIPLGATPVTVDLPVGVACVGWDRPATRAVLVPLSAQGQEMPAGFLVAGLSPVRALDEDYSTFVALVAGQIAGGLANAKAYEAERRRAEALAEIDRAKTAFFSNVSHEFRTPLTLMLGPLEDMLSDPAVRTAVGDRLGVVHRNAERLLKLVNTLLDFSRIEAGRAHALYRRTDLCALTTELASGFRSACEKAGLILEIDCQPLPDDTYVDQDMWEKIVLNLLSNAFKFTFEGQIRVELAASADGTAVELCVQDTGIGIPSAELPKLFDRFHRVEGARGRSDEGSGIGLALVQELVRLHGGAVTVDSIEGKGTRFNVTVPIGIQHLPAERLERTVAADPVGNRVRTYVEEALGWLPASPPSAGDRGEQPGGEHAKGIDRPGGLQPRILVADDNADMRDYIRRLLGGEYEVITVPDGEAALAAIRADRPDLMLSDAMMPRLDGFGLLAAVRSDPMLRDLPFILLSARAGEEAHIEGMAAGADDYLIKPFSSKELIARIRAHLALERLRRDATAHLRARTMELETLLSTLPVGVWFTDDPGASTAWGNRAAAELMRVDERQNVSLSAPEDVRPRHFTIVRGGSEPAVESLPLQRAARGEEVRSEEQDVLFDDGSSITLLLNASPLRDGEGRVNGAVTTAIDITERKQAEERQRLLLEELNHRVKNTLASVQAIAMQTLRTSTPEQFPSLFQARLAALADAHDLLTKRHWAGACLDEVANLTLGPYGVDRVTLSGPAVSLAPGIAVSLHLAFHELATNAAKYGALSAPGGKVGLEWQAGPDEKLLLHWCETGGPPVTPPTRRGFGTRLIERGLAHDLDGDVKLEFAPEGVRCSLRIPFSGRLRLC